MRLKLQLIKNANKNVRIKLTKHMKHHNELKMYSKRIVSVYAVSKNFLWDTFLILFDLANLLPNEMSYPKHS